MSLHIQWNIIHLCVVLYSHDDLTHWGRVTHICVSKLTIIGSDNGLSPERRQAIIWTNVGLLSIGPLGTNLGEILSEIHTFSFKKMHLKTSSEIWRQFCLGLNVLIWLNIKPSSGCPAVREKSGKFHTRQKSGNCQGILLWIGEN